MQSVHTRNAGRCLFLRCTHRFLPFDLAYHDNPLQRYSLGTKNKNLEINADGSLTLYAGATSPGPDKENNWLPAPDGTFSLYVRSYWPDAAILDGTWQPQTVTLMK